MGSDGKEGSERRECVSTGSPLFASRRTNRGRLRSLRADRSTGSALFRHRAEKKRGPRRRIRGPLEDRGSPPTTARMFGHARKEYPIDPDGKALTVVSILSWWYRVLHVRSRRRADARRRRRPWRDGDGAQSPRRRRAVAAPLRRCWHRSALPGSEPDQPSWAIEPTRGCGAAIRAEGRQRGTDVHSGTNGPRKPAVLRRAVGVAR